MQIQLQLEVEKLLKGAKRNCIFCYGRARLRDTDNERNAALKSVSQMYEMFGEHYNDLRRRDAPIESIRLTQEYKMVCRDALDACEACDKTVDSINRHMTKIK